MKRRSFLQGVSALLTLPFLPKLVVAKPAFPHFDPEGSYDDLVMIGRTTMAACPEQVWAVTDTQVERHVPPEYRHRVAYWVVPVIDSVLPSQLAACWKYTPDGPNYNGRMLGEIRPSVVEGWFSRTGKTQHMMGMGAVL